MVCLLEKYYPVKANHYLFIYIFAYINIVSYYKSN